MAENRPPGGKVPARRVNPHNGRSNGDRTRRTRPLRRSRRTAPIPTVRQLHPVVAAAIFADALGGRIRVLSPTLPGNRLLPQRLFRALEGEGAAADFRGILRRLL